MIEILAAAGLVTVQDLGRPGWMHAGVPQGGALVPALLARANATVRNAYETTTIEIMGSVTVTTTDPVDVADDQGTAVSLRPGEPLTLSARATRAAYLAVRGGIDVAPVLGGRGTLIVAGLGGHEGRTLRKGDVLRVGLAEARSLPLPPAPNLHAPIGVIPGPDLGRFPADAVDRLLSGAFEMTERSDRLGARLRGPILPLTDADTSVSAPMMRGAIQIPPDGQAIVLGPDHPTIGGYPVIATVVRDDVGTLFARPPGSAIRFVKAHAKTPVRS